MHVVHDALTRFSSSSPWTSAATRTCGTSKRFATRRRARSRASPRPCAASRSQRAAGSPPAIIRLETAVAPCHSRSRIRENTMANGYILKVPPDRRAVLLEEHIHGPGASEPVKEFTHSKSQPLICFASFEDGVITHVALARAGTWAGSRLRRLHLKDLTELPAHVRFNAVLPKIPRKLKAHVAKRIQSGGLLPPASFGAFVDAVRELLPESNALLDRFSEQRRERIGRLGDNVRRSLAYQKETVATALTI